MSEQQTIDPQALFLVGMHYPNMFEEQRDENNRPAGFRCKVCEETGIRHADRQAHHERHKVDRAHYATEQIRARKENTMAAKPKTKTPLEQGIPVEYLNADGTKFLPGSDATLKSDAVNTILVEEHSYKRDLSKRRVALTLQQAKEILAVRDWNAWLIKALKSEETKAAREKAKAETTKAKVKDEVAAKRAAKTETTDDVKPDPKPEPKPRRGRRVGA